MDEKFICGCGFKGNIVYTDYGPRWVCYNDACGGAGGRHLDPSYVNSLTREEKIDLLLDKLLNE